MALTQTQTQTQTQTPVLGRVPAPNGPQGWALAGRLWSLALAVIGRIADAGLLLDLRCLDDLAGFAALLAAPKFSADIHPPAQPAPP